MADTNQFLRDQLLMMLQGKGAHAGFEEAIKDMPVELRGKRPGGSPHSPWELLEHIRIAQWDIVEFIRSAQHLSPDFPSGYWPATPEPPTQDAWEQCAQAYRADQKAMENLVSDPSTDLFARIPHGDGQTVLREALLIADHTAYHLGQFVLVRKLLGSWK